MKKILFILFIISLLEAKEYIVISSKTMPTLTKNQLKRIFLKKIRIFNNQELIPLNLPTNTSIRYSFEKNILQMSRTQLKAYWTKKHYLGVRAPKKQKSQEAIIKFIQKVPGAIGYIEKQSLPDNLKIVYQWDEK